MQLDAALAGRLRECVRPEEVIALTADLIRIPSHRWEEAEVAAYVTGFMRGMGLDVTVQKVEEGEVRSKQAVGYLRGGGRGPSLLFCGHLDTSTSPPSRAPYRPDLWTHDPFSGDVVDGWIYGLGAVNMKGGVAAMLAAVQALVRAGLRPDGDIVVAAVMGETAGGLGVEYLLASGVRADQAVVTECTDMDVVTVAVSACRGHIQVEGESAHHLPHRSAAQVGAELIAAFGPPFAPIPPDGWLPHTPHPDLPGYPRFGIKEIHTHGGDFCRLTFDCRIIPGVTAADVQRSLEAFLQRRGIRGRVEMPPHPHVRNRPTAEGISRDHPLVQTIARWHATELGRPAAIGSGKRLGGASDAANLLAAGIPTVTYGPGGIDVWPMVDERSRTADIVAAARVLALTAAEVTSA
ncbi:MAG: M20 family metallopeptidase [Armatimonadota bacterium]